MSLAVHGVLLVFLAGMAWSSPPPPDEPAQVMEVTMAWLPPPEIADEAPPVKAAPPPPQAARPPTPVAVARPVAAPHPAPVHAAAVAPALAEVSSSAADGPAAPSQVAAVAPQAGPPPPVAAPAPADEGVILAGYARRFLEQLERHKSYPALSLRRGEEGTVTIRITVAADGRVLDAHPVGEGPSRLETASLEAVAAAAPFPPLPSGLGGDRVVFNLPVTYRLR